MIVWLTLWQTLRKLVQLTVHHPAFVGLSLVAMGEAAMNSWFGWSRGTWLLPQLILAGCLLGNEMVKWCAADGIGQAWRDRERGRMMAWLLVLVCTISISLPAHIGFIGLMRGDVAATRDTGAVGRTTHRDQLELVRAERAKIGPVRAVELITLERDRQREGGRKWQRLEAERIAAVQAGKLDQQIGRHLDGVEQRGSIGIADPQVAVLKWVWPGADDQMLSLWLAIALAVAMEAITSFGFIAVGRSSVVLQGQDMVTVMSQGLVTHPGAATVLEFRATAVEASRTAFLSEDDVWRAYCIWSQHLARPMLQREPFLRMFEALGIKREGATFRGVTLKADWRGAAA